MSAITHVSVLVIVAVCVGTSAAVSANMVSLIMVGKINERLPDDQRTSYLLWGTEVRQRFKQLYPGNRLLMALDCCVLLMIVSLIVVVKFWVFG
jgi:hypothetical protein